MKRLLTTLICITLISGLLLGCGGQKSPAGESAKANKSEAQSKVEKSEAQSKTSEVASKSDTGNKKPVSSKVFKPDELLTADEASKIVGAEITIQKDTLKIDNETGKASTYYDYKLNDSTDIGALFILKQNGAIPKDKLSGNTAEDDYNSELKFAGNNAEPLSGLGDKAFLHKLEKQVNVLYGDYYIFVGFNGENDEKGKEVNLKVAKKIIENINKKK